MGAERRIPPSWRISIVIAKLFAFFLCARVKEDLIEWQIQGGNSLNFYSFFGFFCFSSSPSGIDFYFQFPVWDSQRACNFVFPFVRRLNWIAEVRHRDSCWCELSVLCLRPRNRLHSIIQMEVKSRRIFARLAATETAKLETEAEALKTIIFFLLFSRCFLGFHDVSSKIACLLYGWLLCRFNNETFKSPRGM